MWSAAVYPSAPTRFRVLRRATLRLRTTEDAMKHIILISLLFAIRLDAEMVRVIDIQDGRTIVVDRNGSREAIRLAGVTVVDERRAADLLRWNLVSNWVLLESHASGGHLAFRSPDALFVNRELVLRGYARATERGIEPERNLNVTYLGEVDPPVPPLTSTGQQKGSGTSRRSKARSSRETPRAAPRSAGRSRARAPRR